MPRSHFEKILIALFFLSLPFIHASVFSDGRGYYAYLRSPLIDHNLSFTTDWNSPPLKALHECKACPSSAKQYWNHPANGLLVFNLNGHFYANPITKTGHLPNFYTVGPAILWSPFVVAAHLAVLVADRLGSRIAPDGHSWPYVAALSGATALYGFLGIYLSFQLAKSYVEERWAFWGVLGIWFASSLPMSMYLEPSWSHTHSAFCVSLFLWYWHRTLSRRTWKQWLVLGLLSGLMVDVYLANAIFVLAPALECVKVYSQAWRVRWSDAQFLWKNLQFHLLFAAGAFVAFLPMLITREIVFGNPFTLGMYANVPWNWRSPAFRAVLFSAGHGIFVCTPILLLAVLGLFVLWHLDPRVGGTCLIMTGAFYCLISVYPWWTGVYSFGNRFFISLTPVFVLGLAAAFSWIARLWGDSRVAARRLAPLTMLLILWNFGLLYQWSHFLFFPDGVEPVSWSEVLYNQFRVVPQQILSDMSTKVRPYL
ncbi:MAG TPA: glycosyltransferase family 39 protein [Candidatus Acidoferrales bacterium]|nr:glycosyltransferase family 39 protein [Candidatus Acidoferrales bacterium]